MTESDDWVLRASVALGFGDTVDATVVLDLAWDVAHAVARPVAPVTAYLLALAVARGGDPAAADGLLSALAVD